MAQPTNQQLLEAIQGLDARFDKLDAKIDECFDNLQGSDHRSCR